MKLTLRSYRTEDDFWKIRQFLRTVFLLNDRHEFSWPLYRWDYWRWHVNENIFHLKLEEVVFLWETQAGEIAAVLNPDDLGQAFLQIHPDYRTPGLE